MRAFFCIPIPELPAAAVQHIADRLRSATGMRASWVPWQNYHITLRFLGEIDRDLVADLEELCRDVGEAVAPFQCDLDHVGAFPAIEKAKVLWVGAPISAAFQTLASALSSGLLDLGFPQKKHASVIHTTLARIKDRPDPTLPSVIADVNPIPPITLPMDQIVVMESVLTPRGAVYTPLVTAKLVGVQT